MTSDLFPTKGKAEHAVMAEGGQVTITAFAWRNENISGVTQTFNCFMPKSSESEEEGLQVCMKCPG